MLSGNVECCVCLEEFRAEGDLVPCMLNCGHGVCMKCARRMWKDGGVKCPECRQVTPVERWGVPRKNFGMIQMLQKRAGMEPSLRKAKCRRCGGEASVVC
eukprot:Sspe_Gene.44888::Locus_22089_Transcript_2_2_Confidence_0.600_Length_370::g.44888::m.44888